MTDYSSIDFSPLLNAASDELITHSYVRDVTLQSGGTMALVTLDNGQDHTRPNTLGPRTLHELHGVLSTLKRRAAAGDIVAVGITGTTYIFAAGADLSRVHALANRSNAQLMAQYGHQVLGGLSRLGVPSFAFVNGLALGGAVELALHCTYRTLNTAAAAIAFPEVSLGIVPGWGGATLIPNIIGIERAIEVVVTNPLQNNRKLKPTQAHDFGLCDTLIAPAAFLEESIRWADRVLTGEVTVERPHPPGTLERSSRWSSAIELTRNTLRSTIGTAAKAPYAALDLLDAAKDGDLERGFAREDNTLAELIASDQFHASVYAFTLVQKRAKQPAGAPDAGLAQQVQQVGVIGAGLMASQIALLCARTLRVPVLITDLDQARIDRGIEHVHAGIEKLHARGRISSDDANQLRQLVSGTTDHTLYADCDWVIEAVFENLSVKQQVLADIERIVSDTAVLASNTSSLSMTEISTALAHPERLVGFHFFNPVTVMPLVEVVRARHTSDAALATAMSVANTLGKSAVIIADQPGFAVNRLLAKVFGEAARALDEGTPIAEIEQAYEPLGLPMGPFELINLIGWKVAAHVQDTMVAEFPERFYASENMHRAAELNTVVVKNEAGKVIGLSAEAQQAFAFSRVSATKDEILRRVEDGLVEEITLMLAEGVVQAAEDIDLCMILGAGWPFHNGGITPYLDRVGASERVRGSTFHRPSYATET